MPPAVPPAFAATGWSSRPAHSWLAITGESRAGSPAAHGWYATTPGDRSGFQPRPGLSGVRCRDACPDRRVAVCDWWATLDSNQ